MESVVEVRQLSPNTLLWKVSIGGKEKEWEAEIVEQVPDSRIVWESVDGIQSSGMVTFESLDSERTRITLALEYEPEGLVEKAGDAIGIPLGQVERDLQRFKDFIEKRGSAEGS